MKKFVVALLFVLGGSACWWLISHNTRFPIKAWDVELQSLMQMSLTNLGVEDKDVLSRLNEIKTDALGSYVFQSLGLRLKKTEDIDGLVKDMEKSGATVKRLQKDGKTILQLTKDNRLYGEVTIQK